MDLQSSLNNQFQRDLMYEEYFQDIGHQGTEDKDSAEIANDADMPDDCPSLMSGVRFQAVAQRREPQAEPGGISGSSGRVRNLEC